MYSILTMWAQEEITGNSPPGTSKDSFQARPFYKRDAQRRRGDLLICSPEWRSRKRHRCPPLRGAGMVPLCRWMISRVSARPMPDFRSAPYRSGRRCAAGPLLRCRPRRPCMRIVTCRLSARQVRRSSLRAYRNPLVRIFVTPCASACHRILTMMGSSGKSGAMVMPLAAGCRFHGAYAVVEQFSNIRFRKG